jgi:hypothetical protein
MHLPVRSLTYWAVIFSLSAKEKKRVTSTLPNIRQLKLILLCKLLTGSDGNFIQSTKSLRYLHKLVVSATARRENQSRRNYHAFTSTHPRRSETHKNPKPKKPEVTSIDVRPIPAALPHR